LRAIQTAANATDPKSFREHVHALRGTSGNVGAEALARLCQDLHGMTRERLRLHGDEYVAQLQRELARFEREFTRYEARLRPMTSQ
jgi:HPt (histidine-containing phosphotransfer) domain-containing protein